MPRPLGAPGKKFGRVRLVEGAEGGYTEVQGSPDMVLGVLSKGQASHGCSRAVRACAPSRIGPNAATPGRAWQKIRSGAPGRGRGRWLHGSARFARHGARGAEQ